MIPVFKAGILSYFCQNSATFSLYKRELDFTFALLATKWTHSSVSCSHHSSFSWAFQYLDRGRTQIEKVKNVASGKWGRKSKGAFMWEQLETRKCFLSEIIILPIIEIQKAGHCSTQKRLKKVFCSTKTQCIINKGKDYIKKFWCLSKSTGHLRMNSSSFIIPFFFFFHVRVLRGEKRKSILITLIPTYQLIIRRNPIGESLSPHNSFVVHCIKHSGKKKKKKILYIFHELRN